MELKDGCQPTPPPHRRRHRRRHHRRHYNLLYNLLLHRHYLD